MRVMRIFLLITVVSLAGCYQNAEDSFDTVEPRNDVQIIPSATSDVQVTVIQPGAGEEATATSDQASVDNPPTATVQIQIVEPTATEAATEEPTVRIIQPTASSTPSSLPPPPTQQADTTLPTATEPSVITPDTGPSQLQISTVTPSPSAEETQLVSPDLDATPTDIAVEAAPSECEHVVQAGENAFRIALNNNVTLEALLEANGLPDEPIIQPGQVLLIPGCVPEDVEPTPAADSTEESAAPSGNGTTTVHEVVAGDTMLAIAQSYGVSVNAILEANDLSDPDQLSIGQELVIPQPE